MVFTQGRPPLPASPARPQPDSRGPSWSPSWRELAQLIWGGGRAGPAPGKEKGPCCSSPRIAPSLGCVLNIILFLKGLGERERGTWQHSRNQHYDNAIASLFLWLFLKLEISAGGEVQIKFSEGGGSAPRMSTKHNVLMFLLTILATG